MVLCSIPFAPATCFALGWLPHVTLPHHRNPCHAAIACFPVCLALLSTFALFPALQGNISTADRAADDASGLAALQWVPGSEMQGKGLSSGVKKVRRAWLRCVQGCAPSTFA